MTCTQQYIQGVNTISAEIEKYRSIAIKNVLIDELYRKLNFCLKLKDGQSTTAKFVHMFSVFLRVNVFGVSFQHDSTDLM
jgi:hypothetical protein